MQKQKQFNCALNINFDEDYDHYDELDVICWEVWVGTVGEQEGDGWAEAGGT